MSVTAKVDISKLREKLVALQKGLPDAARESLKELMGGRGVMGLVVAECPADTNRLVNSWSEASQQAKLPPPPGGWPRPAIRPSKYTGKYRERLEQQLKDLKRQEQWVFGKDSSWATRKGVRTGAMRPSAAKHLRRIERAIERTQEDLANLGDTDILMKGGDRRLRQFSTRSKIYGGYGRTYSIGPHAFVTVKSMEPHARTVEKLRRSFAAAMGLLRASGIRRYGKPVLLRTLKRYAPDMVNAA